MNITQKIAALFGAQYIVKIWINSVEIYRAKKVGRYWVVACDGSRLQPQGGINGGGAKWEPLTKGIKRFYDREVI